MNPVDFNKNSVQDYIEDYFRQRKKLTGPLTFIDRKADGNTDYTYIKGLSKDTKHIVEIKKDSELRYSGEFSRYACEFNDDEKTVIITSDVRDDYTIINEGEDIEVNVLNNQSEIIKAQAKSYLTFSCYEYGGSPLGLPEFPETDLEDWDIYCTYHEEHFNLGELGEIDLDIRIFVSERIIVPYYRTMSGWIELEDYGKTKLYGRVPVGYSYPSVIDYGEIDIKISTEKSLDGFNYIGQLKYAMIPDGITWQYNTTKYGVFIKKTVYNGGQYVTGLYNYYYCYSLKNCLNKILNVAVPDFSGEIKSTLLFDDNAETGGPDFKTGYYGTDYITGRYKYEKFLIEKSDFVSSLPSKTISSLTKSPEKATIGNISFKKIINDLEILYQGKWFIDNDGNLRFEHISYKTLKTGINVSSKTTLKKLWKYLNEEIPNRQFFKAYEAWSEDFTQKEIVYGNIPVLEGVKEKTEEFNISFLCTDIDGANQHLNELSTNGFMLIERDNVTADSIKKERGLASGAISIQNAGLSIANYLHYFYRHNSYKENFTMYGVAKTAITLRKLKYQDNVILLNITRPKLDESIQTNIGSGELNILEEPTTEEKLYTAEIFYDE